MKVPMPQPGTTLLDGKSAANWWFKWFHDMWTSAGHNTKVPIYDELVAGPGDVVIPSSDGAVFGELVGDAQVIVYNAGSDLFVSLLFRLPNAYQEGSDLSPWLEWLVDDTNAGTVKWSFEYAIAAAGSSFDAALTVLSETETAPGDTTIQRLIFDDISGDGVTPGDIMLAVLRRSGSADSYGTPVGVLSIGLKYQRRGIGHERAHPWA